MKVQAESAAAGHFSSSRNGRGRHSAPPCRHHTSVCDRCLEGVLTMSKASFKQLHTRLFSMFCCLRLVHIYRRKICFWCSLRYDISLQSSVCVHVCVCVKVCVCDWTVEMEVLLHRLLLSVQQGTSLHFQMFVFLPQPLILVSICLYYCGSSLLYNFHTQTLTHTHTSPGGLLIHLSLVPTVPVKSGLFEVSLRLCTLIRLCCSFFVGTIRANRMRL